ICASPEMVIWAFSLPGMVLGLSLLSCVRSSPGLVLQTFLCLFFAGFGALDFLVFALCQVFCRVWSCVCSLPGLVFWSFLYLFFARFGVLNFLIFFARFGDLDFLVFILHWVWCFGLSCVYFSLRRVLCRFGVLDFLVFVLCQESCFGLDCSSLGLVIWTFLLFCVCSSPGLVLWTFLCLFFARNGALDLTVVISLVFLSFLYLFFAGFGALNFLVFVLRWEWCFGFNYSDKFFARFGDLNFLSFLSSPDEICEIVPSQKGIDKINIRGYLMVKDKYPHNHFPQASSAEVAKSIANIKEQAKETNDQPAQ
ncbi:4685_t:CDS:10, partial [Dentiscutata heterogama]